MQKMLADIDSLLWLRGDEDGDVSVQCRHENRGGLPVIFYTIDVKNNAYRNCPDVIIVHTITALINACVDHCDFHATLKPKT